MKKRIKLKKLPFILIAILLIPLLAVTFYFKNDLKEDEVEEPPKVMETVKPTTPVVSETNFIMNPYTNANVVVGRSYYDYKANEEEQENSITIYDNTYYQNTGIDYTCDQVFDVISIMEGTIIDVKENDKTGKEIKIEHKNGLISIYQSLSDVYVKKGDPVSRGQLIGKSGTNELDKDLGNHLHFEIIENGNNVNPNNYLNKEYKKEN